MPICSSTRVDCWLHEDVDDEYNDAPYVGIPPCHDAENVTDFPSVIVGFEGDILSADRAEPTFTVAIADSILVGVVALSVTSEQ